MSELPTHGDHEGDEELHPNPHNNNGVKLVAGLLALGALTVYLVNREPPEPPQVESTAETPKPIRQSPAPAVDLSTQVTTSLAKGAITAGFVKVKGRTYTMGNAEEQRREVTISYDFEIQATEVTQGQYKKLMGSNPSFHKKCGDNCPVERVSWFDAAAYCDTLSKRRGLKSCYVRLPDKVVVRPGVQLLTCPGYRLPTEAEWELAARAGSEADTYGVPTEISWYDSNSGLVSRETCTKKKNALGLCDMLGNVAEWVWDWMEDPLPKEAATDPVELTQRHPTQSKVFRGGHFRQDPIWATHGHREGYHPANKVKEIGFRCVRTLL